MKTPFVSCVIVDDYGKLLLLHREGDDVSYWELPGGIVEEDESVDQALSRHLGEYMGIEVELQKVLGHTGDEDDEQDYLHVWILGIVRSAHPTLNDTDAYDDLDYFEIEDLQALSLSLDAQMLLDKILAGEIILDNSTDEP